jgi:RHS repeat-associated protein
MSGYHSFIYFAGFHLARVDGVIGGTGKKYFYHNDHLGSALAVTDEEGNKVIERDFLPFGEIINLQEGLNPYADGSGFTGKDWDEEIGLYYFNARWYDPEIGRFITEDPLMDEPNLYSYGFNNPIRYLDPTGMFNVSIPKVIIDFTDFATKTMDSFEKMISPILDPLQKAYETYDTIYRYVYNIITIIDPDNDILEELESIDAKFKPLRGAIKNWRNFKDKNKTTKYLSGAAKIWNELDRMGYSFFDAIRFLAT